MSENARIQQLEQNMVKLLELMEDLTKHVLQLTEALQKFPDVVPTAPSPLTARRFLMRANQLRGRQKVDEQETRRSSPRRR